MSKAKDVQELLTPGDAAKLIGCGSQRIRDLVRLGKLAVAGRTPSGWRLFTRESVERYLDERLRDTKTRHAAAIRKIG
jgi:DNA-binding transcriptional MerR regulator